MIDRVVIGCFVVLVVLVLVEVLVVDMHAKVGWEQIPGHMALIGFVSHMLIVLLCKLAGKHFLQRPEPKDE